jgi:hypothetical protein
MFTAVMQARTLRDCWLVQQRLHFSQSRTAGQARWGTRDFHFVTRFKNEASLFRSQAMKENETPPV